MTSKKSQISDNFKVTVYKIIQIYYNTSVEHMAVREAMGCGTDIFDLLKFARCRKIMKPSLVIYNHLLYHPQDGIASREPEPNSAVCCCLG